VGILVLNPLLLETTDADPELVDRVDKVDTDRPLPLLALVDLIAMGPDVEESEVTEVDREPSRNRRRGGRSISANVGLGTDILFLECWVMINV
jgi:hypothetical protein